MIIIVDSNILFSVCIATEKKSRLSEIFFRTFPDVRRISCHYALDELTQHREKLIKASKLPADKLDALLFETLKQVTFYDESTISPKYWEQADQLTKDVDSKDIAFVALALQTGGMLWTGDKKLSNHIKTMGFERVLSTAELALLLNIEY